MDFHEFRVKALHPSSSPVIKGTSYNDQYGTLFTIFKDGTIINRAPTEKEADNVLDRALVGTITNEKGEKIYMGDYKFIPEQYEDAYFKGKPEIDKYKNTVEREWYRFLLTHDHVVTKNGTGDNTNDNNRYGVYELIDTTKNTNREATKNKLKVAAGKALSELYEGDKKAFIEFCYAYNLPSVELWDTEKLFNMCWIKMNDNPEFFMSVYSNKNREILSIISIGLHKNIGTNNDVKKALEKSDNGAFYLDGQPIAKSEKELVEVLLLDIDKRKILEHLIDFRVTPVQLNEIKETADASLTTEVTKNEADIAKYDEQELKGEFIKKARPLIVLSKDIVKRDEKLFALYSRPEYKNIIGWCQDEIAKLIEKRTKKEDEPFVLSSIEV